MKGNETGKDKVKKICEVLRKETLEPAKQEAESIISEAHAEAERIVSEARRKADYLLSDAKAEIEKRKAIFQTSLHQAGKQAIESLKQQIEERLFSRELGHLIAAHTQDPKVLSQLTAAVVHALEKEGIDADLSVYIPATVQAKAVNALLVEHVLSKLKEKSVLLGPMAGGIEVVVKDKHISIDITDQALKELLMGYMRKEFREHFFEKE